MKNYRETIARIEANKKEIKLKTEELGKINLKQIEKVSAISNRIYYLNAENAILHDNARHEYINEYLPKALDILSNYNGKRIGEKTKEKIRQEAIEKGFRVHFCYHNYDCIELDFKELDENGKDLYIFKYDELEVFYKDNNRALYVDGKLDIPTDKENYRINYISDYAENVEQRTNEVIEKFNKTVELGREYEKAIKEYNALRPVQFKRLSVSVDTRIDANF